MPLFLMVPIVWQTAATVFNPFAWIPVRHDRQG
jgi:hypothetical protein